MRNLQIQYTKFFNTQFRFYAGVVQSTAINKTFWNAVINTNPTTVILDIFILSYVIVLVYDNINKMFDIWE